MALRRSSLIHPNCGNQENHHIQCQQCHHLSFKLSSDFVKHLRDRHCTKEGGSYVCRYGNNDVCINLPLEGVSEPDYESHLAKYHVNVVTKEVPEEWSVYLAAQNLSAVLNDPIKGKQTNLFTKKWGDYFVEKVKINNSPYLEDVQWEDFDSYLKRIGKRYKRHQRLAHLNYNLLTSEPNVNSINIGNLEDVPEIFKSEMNLNDPTTFNQVFPGISDKSDESRTSVRLLQEKLSHYLDIVEVRIAKQVSAKSSVFFHAMTSQDTIMEEMSLASGNVKNLRKELSNLKLNLVDNSLRIMQLTKKKQNMQNVLDKLKLMSTVHKTQPMLQLLLGTQDYVAALDLISTTQEILQQELLGISCFKHLPMQLDEMEKLIDKMLTTEFERYSTTDLNRLLHNSNNSGSETTSLDTEAEDLERVVAEDKLVSIIMGLLRKKNFTFIDMYKEESIVTIKAIIKQLVIEVIATSDADVCLVGAGEEAQTLSISEWIDLLERATNALFEILSRIKTSAVVMLQTADSAAGKCGMNLNFFDSEAFLSSSDHQIVENRLRDMILSICNYCHERCANLVSDQSLEKSVATPYEIQKLNEIVEQFSKGCEEISGVQSAHLKMIVKVQASRFASKFHAERKAKLSLVLDNEKWKQVDIPSEFQKLVDKIAENKFICSKTEIFNSAINGGSQANPVLLVDGKPFALITAALTLVQMMNDYCNCASQLPIIAIYHSMNIIDLMRTFNSRSCQLVIGAGALRVAGLKTITIGNLALVSRAIQFVLWLLPKVRKHFKSLEPTSSHLKKIETSPSSIDGFDSIEKDFTSHIKEIEAKILVIVSDLVGNQLRCWDARPPVPSQAFRNISRHFVKLHEAVSSILPEPQIQDIYRHIHKSFKNKLRDQLLKCNIVKNGGPQHGVVTSELTFYMETLRTIKALPADELGDNDETLEDIWIK